MTAFGNPLVCGETVDPGAILGRSDSIPHDSERFRSRSTGILFSELEAVWAETLGEDSVCIAILDGPVDLSHPALRGANLTQLDGLVPGTADNGPACQHGTHIASIIFGRHDGSVRGIAPHCRGVLVPVFESADDATFRPCNQLDLARAITAAALAGAHVINISGGQFAPGGAAHPLLADVVRDCARRNILLVAAVGNEGCECLHIPAALESVLAVGAMSAEGEPLSSSNWGGVYQTQGILAPGEHLPGARPGGGVAWGTGSSYATAVVSGVAGLLLSLQVKYGRQPDPQFVRQALLDSAQSCDTKYTQDCRRWLAGRLDIPRAVSLLSERRCAMIEASKAVATSPSLNPRHADGSAALISELPERPAPQPGGSEAVSERTHSQPTPRAETQAEAPCSCKRAAVPQLIYVLGRIGYDFPGEARLDSIVQKMATQAGISPPERGLAFDPRRILAYLERNSWDAAAIEWTLNLDGTPVYAVRPQGPFAADAYAELRRFLHDQLTEGVERVSIPGVLAGQARLLNGQTVPVIVPDLRGMYSWTTASLVEAVVGRESTAAGPGPERDGQEQKRIGVRNFLDRVYHETRNLGLTPQDRALNFAATNIFEIGEVFAAALKDKMDLDHVHAVPSPLGRPGSDCWDIEVYFFYPERQVQTVRKVYRLTVDVSDTVPVTIGQVHSWFTR